MNFRYKKIGDYRRPIIPIKVQYKKSTVRQEVLLDSGADFCIFRGEIGELIGLDIKKGEKIEFGGITGDSKTGYIHKVGLTVGNITHTVKVVFSYDISDNGFGIVGQLGFFEYFSIKFDYQKRTIVLRTR